VSFEVARRRVGQQAERGQPWGWSARPPVDLTVLPEMDGGRPLGW